VVCPILGQLRRRPGPGYAVRTFRPRTFGPVAFSWSGGSLLSGRNCSGVGLGEVQSRELPLVGLKQRGDHTGGSALKGNASAFCTGGLPT
jgi:hypothetical protein